MSLSNIKLPHWVMGIAGALAMILPWALKQESSGVFQVPTWVIPVETGLVAVLGYLGFTSPSVSPTVNAMAAQKFAVKKAAGLAVFLVTGSMYFGGDTACTGVQVPSSVVGPTIQTISCILTTVAVDLVMNHDTWEVTVANTISTCGTDAATIETVWDAHVKAEVTEGVVPKYSLPVDGGH
jgi:hypothetical protein